MKRSELVKIIEDTLEELVQKNLIDKDGFDVCAEVIMKKVEKAGMEPPYSDKIWQEQARIYIYPNGNKWEKEDE